MRVAVTRPLERADDTAWLVRKRGWEPLIVPAVEIVPRPISLSVKLEDFDWLVVTSASGVEVLWNHFKESLRNIDIAVVGPKTKAMFMEKGIAPKVVASEHVGEGLARDLEHEAAGKKVLIARAAIARKELVEMLSEKSIVTEIAIYDTIAPRDKTGLKRFKTLLEKRGLDAVIFTSSQMARNLIDFVGKEGVKRLNEIVTCAIGPVTARTLKEYGVKMTCMPSEYTIDAALSEISKHISTMKNE